MSAMSPTGEKLRALKRAPKEFLVSVGHSVAEEGLSLAPEPRLPVRPPFASVPCSATCRSAFSSSTEITPLPR